MAHLVQLWLENQRYWFRILAGSDVCHRGCANTVLQTFQRPGVRSVVYVIKHYEEPLKLFDKSPANMRRWPNVGLLLAHRLRRWPYSKPTLGQRVMFAGSRVYIIVPTSGFFLSRYCHDCAESDDKAIFSLLTIFI